MIRCALCDTEMKPPANGLLDSKCKCGSVTVVWDVFISPAAPIFVRALDSRSLPESAAPSGPGAG